MAQSTLTTNMLFWWIPITTMGGYSCIGRTRGWDEEKLIGNRKLKVFANAKFTKYNRYIVTKSQPLITYII